MLCRAVRSLPLHKISTVIKSWLVSVARLSVTGRVMGHIAAFNTVQRLHFIFLPFGTTTLHPAFTVLVLQLSVLSSHIKKQSKKKKQNQTEV